MKTLLAQELQISGYQIQGPLPTDAATGVSSFNTVGDVLNVVLKALFPLALFVVFVYILWAGFDMARSMGNADLVKKARARITNAVIGIIILSISYWLAQIAKQIFWGP